MTALSKLVAAFAAGALVVSLAGDASAKSRPVKLKSPAPEQAAQPPSSPPQQLFAAKGVQPLAPELEQTLKPKDSFKECEFCPEMVVVRKALS
jgi:hypothetical protein